jgi:hypothetical protein
MDLKNNILKYLLFLYASVAISCWDGDNKKIAEARAISSADSVLRIQFLEDSMDANIPRQLDFQNINHKKYYIVNDPSGIGGVIFTKYQMLVFNERNRMFEIVRVKDFSILIDKKQKKPVVYGLSYDEKNRLVANGTHESKWGSSVVISYANTDLPVFYENENSSKVILE